MPLGAGQQPLVKDTMDWWTCPSRPRRKVATHCRCFHSLKELCFDEMQAYCITIPYDSSPKHVSQQIHGPICVWISKVFPGMGQPRDATTR